MYRLYRLEPGDGELTRDRLVAYVHPDDRGSNVVADAIAAGATDFTNEYRIVLPDGSHRWLAARGSLVADRDGQVSHVIGTLLDVTEARRLDRMRSEFVANAAHELRTPLTTVSAMASLLAAQRDKLSAAELDGAFDALGRQGSGPGRWSPSLLDLSRLETGSVRITMAPTDVADVVAQALETAPPPDSSRVAVDVPHGLTAVTDADRLHEIVVNLLTNAYRYGGHAVSVSAHNGAGAVRLAVADDGNGVPESFVGEMFQPFSRAAAVTGDTRVGARPDHLAPAGQGGRRRPRLRTGGQGGTVRRDVAGRSVSKVLVVDDEPDIALICRLTLTLAGDEVDDRGTGEAALDYLADQTPDVVLLDLRLPDLSGWDVLDRLRDSGRLLDLNVILFSAHASAAQDARKARAACRSSSKPFTPDDLVKDVTAAAGMRRNVT